MAPSVGIIIYLFRLKIHRTVWCWVGWRVGTGWKSSRGLRRKRPTSRKARDVGHPQIPHFVRDDKLLKNVEREYPAPQSDLSG